MGRDGSGSNASPLSRDLRRGLRKVVIWLINRLILGKITKVYIKIESQTLDICAEAEASVRDSQWDAPFEPKVQKSA